MNSYSLNIKTKYLGIPAKYFLALVLISVVISSCEINDPVGEISAPGYIAANIYWDIPVTNVTAGTDVDFYAEYWSTDETIEYLGVWYNIDKTLNYTLIYPANGYTFTRDSTELAREFLEIKTFAHSEDNYDAEKKAYVIEDQFPISYTLASLDYENPSAFNEEQFNQLIPAEIQEQFLNNLFPQLGYQDFRNLLRVYRQVIEDEVFENYFDTIMEGGTEIRVMKAEAEEALRSHLNELPFGDLIYNRNRQYYAVEFSQNYQLNAQFRIVNGNEVENFSEAKAISVF